MHLIRSLTKCLCRYQNPFVCYSVITEQIIADVFFTTTVVQSNTELTLVQNLCQCAIHKPTSELIWPLCKHEPWFSGLLLTVEIICFLEKL